MAGFNGIPKRIDAAEINGRIFLNNASFGLYADIVDHPEYRGHKLAVSRKVLGSLLDGSQKPYALHFAHGTAEFGSAVQVLVGVNRYNMVNLFELGRRERLDGGELQILALIDLNAETMRHVIRSVSIDTLRNQQKPAVEEWTAAAFKIAGQGTKLVVGVDGEREVFTSPVTIRLLPGALTIYVPAEGVVRRSKNPFTLPAMQSMPPPPAR